MNSVSSCKKKKFSFSAAGFCPKKLPFAAPQSSGSYAYVYNSTAVMKEMQKTVLKM